MEFELNIGTLTNTGSEYGNLMTILSGLKENIDKAIVDLTECGWSGEAKDKFELAHTAKQELYIKFQNDIEYMRSALEHEEKPRAVKLRIQSEDFLNCIKRSGSESPNTNSDSGIISLAYGGLYPINNNVDNCTINYYKSMNSDFEEIINIANNLEYTSFSIGGDVFTAESYIRNQTTSLTDFDKSFNMYYNGVKEMESNICSVLRNISEMSSGSNSGSSSVISASGDIDKNTNLLTVESNGDVKFNDSDQVFWNLNENATDEEMKKSLIEHGYTEDRVNQIFNQGTLRMAYCDWINNHNIELNLDEDQYTYLYICNQYGTKWMLHNKTLNGEDVKDIEKKIFKTVYQRNPKYYAWVDGSWNEDTSGTNNSFSEVDAIIGIEEVPPTLEELVTGAIVSGSMLMGAGEVEILAAGIEQFGWKAGVWLYTCGVLPMTLNTLNGETAATVTAVEQQIINEETAKLETAGSEAEIAAIKEEMQTKIEAAKTAETSYVNSSEIVEGAGKAEIYTDDMRKYIIPPEDGFDALIERRYIDIRKAGFSDVSDIAKNTGLPEQDIIDMKNHLFFNTHDLSVQGKPPEKLYFQGNANISYSWEKAKSGELTETEQDWFEALRNHELKEKKYMDDGMPLIDPSTWDPVKERQGIDSLKNAHDKANLTDEAPGDFPGCADIASKEWNINYMNNSNDY